MCGSLLWCCGTSLGLVRWNRLQHSAGQQLVVSFWGCSWENYIRPGFQKGDAGSGPGEGWSAMMLSVRKYDMGWIRSEILVKWHQPKTTLQVCFFSRESWLEKVWLPEWFCFSICLLQDTVLFSSDLCLPRNLCLAVYLCPSHSHHFLLYLFSYFYLRVQVSHSAVLFGTVVRFSSDN